MNLGSISTSVTHIHSSNCPGQNEDRDLNLIIVYHHPYLLFWFCIMAGSLLNVIQTKMQLTGTRTQIHMAPLYYSIGFFLYRRCTRTISKGIREKKCSQFNTI